MPNRNAHVLAGVGFAGTIAWLLASDLPAGRRWVVVLAAGSIGAFSGALPDILEPALSPHHRQFFHSITVVAGLGRFSATKAREWVQSCRELADKEIASRRKAGIIVDESCDWSGWDIVHGLTIGFLAGYISHLLLDGQTRRGLPVI